MYCKSATRKKTSQKLVSSFKKKIHSFSVLSKGIPGVLSFLKKDDHSFYFFHLFVVRFWLYLYNSFYCTMCCYLTFLTVLTAVKCELNMDWDQSLFFPFPISLVSSCHRGSRMRSWMMLVGLAVVLLCLFPENNSSSLSNSHRQLRQAEDEGTGTVFNHF